MPELGWEELQIYAADGIDTFSSEWIIVIIFKIILSQSTKAKLNSSKRQENW